MITMAHGGGGIETKKLISETFAKYFKNDHDSDAAILGVSPKVAFTTDSFVVKPLVFPGGDIGRLAVCGTVNDLLTAGAKPLYLSAGFIIGEGLSLDTLDAVCRSMAGAADEAGVRVVTGDTKVVEGSGGLYINTSGLGVFDSEPITLDRVRVGDALIVTGTLGEHHACILSRRLNLSNDIQSDAAPLTAIAAALKDAQIPIHGMRDVTRGGLATVLAEIAESTGFAAEIHEKLLPISPEVAAFCGILGLDPLYMGNEGKMLIIVPEECSQMALNIIKSSDYGRKAAIIGAIQQGKRPIMVTRLGGRRILPPLLGEGLPRIC
ncbi:hydrogenase expression/formation protein HypE [Clostridia bacterium]|nr:hydrogenase expression/formation protein HypE [Clostridia bacterium]